MGTSSDAYELNHESAIHSNITPVLPHAPSSAILEKEPNNILHLFGIVHKWVCQSVYEY